MFAFKDFVTSNLEAFHNDKSINRFVKFYQAYLMARVYLEEENQIPRLTAEKELEVNKLWKSLSFGVFRQNNFVDCYVRGEKAKAFFLSYANKDFAIIRQFLDFTKDIYVNKEINEELNKGFERAKGTFGVEAFDEEEYF